MIGFRLLSFPLEVLLGLFQTLRKESIKYVYMVLLFSTFVEALNRIHKETLPHRSAKQRYLEPNFKHEFPS